MVLVCCFIPNDAVVEELLKQFETMDDEQIDIDGRTTEEVADREIVFVRRLRAAAVN